MHEVLSKICLKCRVEKDLEEFFRDNSRKDGLQIYCKECSSKNIRASFDKNAARETIAVPEFKFCPTCGQEKASFLFFKSNIRKDGLCSYCKKCMSICKRKRKFGISDEQYQAMLKAQGGACAICKWIPGPGDRELDTDHIHGTDIVRGLLHHKCNRGLGFFKDSIAIISKAIDYLNGPTTGILYKKTWGKHGVPAEIKEQILASQGYLCRICSVDLHNKKACVDHDHLTMIIRGILCDGCNSGLGQFDDSIEFLTDAIKYLRNVTDRLATKSPTGHRNVLASFVVEDHRHSEPTQDSFPVLV